MRQSAARCSPRAIAGSNVGAVVGALWAAGKSADEIVAMCGGMYYGQEAPGKPTFVHEGMHFEKGQPLYIIEVMKMFNKVHAAFAGTVTEVLVETAMIAHATQCSHSKK